MDAILSALLNDHAALEDRRVEQVVAICGNGLLTDSSVCSNSFREFLKNVPSRILKKGVPLNGCNQASGSPWLSK
jgi:hypothetical protein